MNIRVSVKKPIYYEDNKKVAGLLDFVNANKNVVPNQHQSIIGGLVTKAQVRKLTRKDRLLLLDMYEMCNLLTKYKISLR